MITSKALLCIQFYSDQEAFAESCFLLELCRVDASNHLPLTQAKTILIILDGQHSRHWISPEPENGIVIRAGCNLPASLEEFLLPPAGVSPDDTGHVPGTGRLPPARRPGAVCHEAPLATRLDHFQGWLVIAAQARLVGYSPHRPCRSDQ